MKKHRFDLVPETIRYTESPHHARHVSGLVAGRPSGVNWSCRFQVELSLVDATYIEVKELQQLLERIVETHGVIVEAP